VPARGVSGEHAQPGESGGGAFLSDNGGAGVHWARTFWPESDLVIGIGQLTDIEAADIRLPNQFKLEEAVSEVIRQAEALVS
jgi:hypothetical protein